ncbi:hypothetical protein AAEY33_02915 [Peribacillus simplex]|uniref:hypothetical protein n=1 Tax=Peribacillus simplex TaxID=1478 RepID=UPI003263D530
MSLFNSTFQWFGYNILSRIEFQACSVRTFLISSEYALLLVSFDGLLVSFLLLLVSFSSLLVNFLLLLVISA